MRGRGGSARGVAIGALAALAVACGSTGPAAKSAPKDAGPPQSDSSEADAVACTGADVLCDGVCRSETVMSCGPSCMMCPTPAISHGTSACVSHQCTLQCTGPYAPCGTGSCCGVVTTGDIANVAVGGNTSCAVTIGGEVFCWGDGAYGALSDGTVGDQSPSPVAAMGFAAGAVTLALGDHHGCALLTGQTVQCWGDDEQGQLGDGQRQPRATPVTPISLPPEVTGVATGGSHTCVTTASGSVWCWGDNTSGQLGTSANSSEVQPTEVPGLTTAATAVAAGEAFTCALVAGGRVQCWGDGSNGQIGMMGGSSTPVTVSLPAPVTAIAAGAQHACAITMSGTVMCWGADTANQLGSPGSSSQTTPVVVPGVSGVVAISAGGNETCIIDSSGAVDCWGSDPVGDMGAGPAGPGVVPSLTSGVAKVSAVGGHACAVTKGGAPKCWGTNDAGNLGDGSMLQSWAPIDVPAI